MVEETNIVFHTTFLQFSIFQLLECSRLEVSLEEKLHSIVFDRMLFDRKINIDPKYRVLVPLPCTVHASRSTWYREVNVFRVSVTFISWINRQEEHCLSSAQILTSRYQSIPITTLSCNVGSIRFLPECP